MADLLDIPLARLAPDVLAGLLEEFASRDGTDYGDRELSLEQKVAQLRRQLDSGDMRLLYDSDSETWDLVSRDMARALLAGETIG
ncbi:YheU family protein [Haliea sp. E1-2-M8]|uniref:YheU family protein n=1 Tax=Haliea sp. E1-2-M8 TaxID=3064706 RepID=UPI00272343BE|nr:YheU family protein [Haliea sp. E1-2-M8]MDO8863898.1 YheU family protein [Haliea sp. E1-2-M8]